MLKVQRLSHINLLKLQQAPKGSPVINPNNPSRLRLSKTPHQEHDHLTQHAEKDPCIYNSLDSPSSRVLSRQSTTMFAFPFQNYLIIFIFLYFHQYHRPKPSCKELIASHTLSGFPSTSADSPIFCATLLTSAISSSVIFGLSFLTWSGCVLIRIFFAAFLILNRMESAAEPTPFSGEQLVSYSSALASSLNPSLA